MKPFHATSRVCIFGRTGQGKTDLARALQEFYPRIIILDVVADYKPDGKTHFFRDFRKFGEFLVRYQRAPKFKLCFQFDFASDFQETAEEIFQLIYRLGDVLVVIDEAQEYKYSEFLTRLVLMGRHQNIALLCSTQRPANLSKNIVSQASDVLVANLFETNDLKYLGDFLPADAVELLPSLPKFHFLHYRPGESPRVIYNREPWKPVGRQKSTACKPQKSVHDQ